ncbi:universal stress protein [Streptomyces spororaveus]|uniref:universal stress protein n=1 Tax=Streptomyces spororaveus TaxID=284039 RepID=UPI0027E4EB89|nr:universal stress protein [Streptomyces spororaveus]
MEPGTGRPFTARRLSHPAGGVRRCSGPRLLPGPPARCTPASRTHPAYPARARQRCGADRFGHGARSCRRKDRTRPDAGDRAVAACVPRPARHQEDPPRPPRAKVGGGPEVRVEVDCSVGQPANRLVEASADASLVDVGRRIRRSAIGTRLGPVVHAVLHHATVPVAFVPHP